MNFLFLICTTLLCTSLSIANLMIENVLFDHRDNLKLFLDWCDQQSKASIEEQHKYVEEFNRQYNVYMVYDFETIEARISSFFTAAAHFRSLLISGRPGEAISDNLVDNVKLLPVFMRNMDLVLSDLMVHTRLYKNNLKLFRHSGTVMDEISKRWFKEHGFDESSLNDISLNTLEVALQKFHYEHGAKKNTPFSKLMELLGSLYMLAPGNDIGSRLAWLSAIGYNKARGSCITSYIMRKGRGIQQSTADDIFKCLGYLAHEQYLLMNLLGNERDEKIQPFMMPLLHRSSYLDDHLDRYIEIMDDIRSNMYKELESLKVALENIDRTNPINLYREFGFVYDNDKLDTETVLKMSIPLVDHFSFVPDIPMIVKEYAKEMKEIWHVYITAPRCI